MTPLGSVLQAELRRRDLSPEEFGQRSGLGTSHVYQIIRGVKVNPRQDTLEKIAAGLDWTLADLAARLGSGLSELTRDQLDWLTIINQIPTEDHQTAKKILSSLRATNGHRDGASIQHPGSRRAHDARTRSTDESADHGGLPTVFGDLKASIANVLAPVKRLIGPGAAPRVATRVVAG